MSGRGRKGSPIQRLFPRRSAGSRELIARARKVAAHEVPILIVGETGTGKSLLAEAIHLSGPRAQEPFVAIDCGAIPVDLFESELFGYERGTFTGAYAQKRGRLESAGRGSVLLDDIGSLALTLQPKLLRVLQERRFSRLGGSRSLPLQARTLATSSRPLDAMVREGAFREDLYYRLNVVVLEISPLRARKDEIAWYADRFLEAAAERQGTKAPELSDAALSRLAEHSWPGNLRELRNVMERIVAIGDGSPVSVRELQLSEAPDEIVSTAGRESWSLETLERRYIREVLRLTRSNFTRAAAILGINRKTLLEKRRRYGLE